LFFVNCRQRDFWTAKMFNSYLGSSNFSTVFKSNK
jgi:hypothetical protein